MFENKQGSDIRENYNIMLQVAEQMLADEQDICANLANLSALINNYMDKLNWVGFYLMKDGELVLGPFQGKPACVRIQVGRGVCGTTAAQHKITVVDNVHEFEGHIACDSASNSEIVRYIAAAKSTAFSMLTAPSLHASAL